MDTTSKLLFAVGGLLALVVGIMVYFTLSATQGLGRAMGTVVVARQEIPERTLFTGSNVDQLLTTQQLPREVIPAESLTRSIEAIGKATTLRLAPGEIVLASPERLAGGEGVSARAAASIPRDKVALAVPAGESVSVAGAVQPGDRVDVIATWTQSSGNPITQDIFQDVRVFAVGAYSIARASTTASAAPASTGSGPTPTITLLLDYQQAVALEYLLQTGGKVSLALRRFDQGDTVPTEPMTADALTRRLLVDGAAPRGP